LPASILLPNPTEISIKHLKSITITSFYACMFFQRHKCAFIFVIFKFLFFYSLGCRQDCKSVPTKQCRAVPQQKCHPVSSKVCLNIPNQKCDVLPAEKCLTIPVLTTSNVCQVTPHHLQCLSDDSSPPPTFVR